MKDQSILKEIPISDIDGFFVGHCHDENAGTGCSVVLCPEGAAAGVDVRGGSPGTRETDLLRSENMIQQVHGVVLAGGSAFGLDVSSGVMQFLEENHVGFDTAFAKVPIVCSAVLFDLGVGSSQIRPDKSMGYRASQNAWSKNHYGKKEIIQGNAGAGMGASVGKLLGMDYAMKGGLGIAAVQVGEIKIGAMVAVNAVGDIVQPWDQKVIAGLLTENKEDFRMTTDVLLRQSLGNKGADPFHGPAGENTTIGVVLCNANITKSQANKIASMAHNGLARTISPSHTMFDGDTLFVLGRGEIQGDSSTLGMLAAVVVEKAILNGVNAAKSKFGLQAANDMVK